MAKLFLDGIFTDSSDSPSSVTITMPTDRKKINLTGLMQGDVSFSAQNNWGTIISDLTNLQDLASLAGSENMFTWIKASTMCWKGTNPLSIGIEFFLINYKKGLNLEEQLEALVALASLEQNVGATWNSGEYTARVHGGYAPDLFSNNKDLFFTLGDIRSIYDGNFQKITSYSENDLMDKYGYAKGSLQLKFGNKSTIRNVLLSKINVTESLVEVADQSGGNKKPLYYKVSAQFTGVRPLITSDVAEIFGFRSKS